MSTNYEKLLEEAAGKKLAGKKKQLQSSYDQSLEDLAELERGAERQARESATQRTAEAKQDRAAWNEIQTAQGLTSGAQSQALLAMDNQLRGDLRPLPTPGMRPRRSWPGSVRPCPGTWPSSWSRLSWRVTMSR